MDTKIQAPMPAPLKELDLIRQVGEWSEYNFAERRKPELGIVEEIGEAVHCVLKRLQKIRGFDDEPVFMEKFIDALSDTVIYLADWCHIHNTYFQFSSLPDLPAEGANEDRIIAHLLQTCSVIFGAGVTTDPDSSVNHMIAQRLLNALNYWAVMYGVNLALTTSLTWAKVKQRDWKANPAAPLPEHA